VLAIRLRMRHSAKCRMEPNRRTKLASGSRMVFCRMSVSLTSQ
jgi:hypothetical protein